MHLNRSKINLLMAENEISVLDLASRCGVTSQRISCILNSVSVTPKTAGRISKALGVNVTEILADE